MDLVFQMMALVAKAEPPQTRLASMPYSSAVLAKLSIKHVQAELEAREQGIKGRQAGLLVNLQRDNSRIEKRSFPIWRFLACVAFRRPPLLCFLLGIAG